MQNGMGMGGYRALGGATNRVSPAVTNRPGVKCLGNDLQEREEKDTDLSAVHLSA